MLNLPLSDALEQKYYQSDDVVGIARDLIGRTIYSRADGLLTAGIIVETEAYRGPEDRGSHAFGGLRTARNEMMYAGGGSIYMYICYGIHDMLNIVTGVEGSSHAILIRAIQPVIGIDIMELRRASPARSANRLGSGPGLVAKVLGLGKKDNGRALDGELIWVGADKIRVDDGDIVAAPRIGLNIPEPFLSIPWRFYLKGNASVSRK